MTKPENPDPAETNGWPTPDAEEGADTPDTTNGVEPEAPVAVQSGPDAAPREPAPEESALGEPAPPEPALEEAAVEEPEPGDLPKEPTLGSPATESTLGDLFKEPAPGNPAGEPAAERSSAEEPPRDGSANGATAAALPKHRAETPAAEGESLSARLQRPIGRAYGSSSSDSGTAATRSRYGQPVANPFTTQPSRGAMQDFTGPTVRIGGRVPAGQVPSQPSVSTRVRPARVPRRTSLQLRYLEPWSVLKVSLVLSVAGFLAWMVAVGVLYSVLGSMGVWDQLNGTYSDLTSVTDPRAGQDLISAGGVFGVAAVVGLVNIVLVTAMCTVGAFIYNASADLAGGIEVTLSEPD